MSGSDFTVSMVLRAVNQMTPTLREATRQLQQLQTQIKQVNKASNGGNWFDKAITGISRFQTKIKTAQDAMDKLVKSGESDIMTGSIMALPLVGMIKSAAQVQRTQTSLQLAGLTNSQINTLTSNAQGTMRKTMFNTGQVLGIDLQLAQVGMNYSRIKNVAQSATYLAELEANRNGADPNTTAKQFAQMTEQLQISTNPTKVKQLADLVNRISTVTSASVSSLSDSSRYFNLVGKIQGLTPSDILLTQGLAARYGLEGSIGGTNLKDFFERLNPQLHMNTMMGKPIVNAFKSMGWLKNIKYDSKGTTITGASDVFHDKSGNLLPAQQIFGIIAQTYKKMGNKEEFNALMTRIFGQQGQAIAAAVGQNPQAFTRLKSQMARVPTVNQGIATYQKTFNQQFHSFTSTLSDFGRQMGTMVLPQLTTYIKRLNEALPKVQKFIDSHKNLLKIMLEIYAGLAGAKIGGGILKIAVGGPMKEILGLTNGILGIGKAGVKSAKYLKGVSDGFKYFREGSGTMSALWKAVAFGNPTLMKLGKTLGPVVKLWAKFSGWSTMAKGLKTVTGAVKTFIPFVSRITGLTKLWKLAQAALDVVMDTNPLALTIMGIVAATGLLVVGIVELVKHWKQVVAWAKSVWNWYNNLGDRVKWLIAVFVPFIGLPALIVSKWGVIQTFFANLWTRYLKPVVDGLTNSAIGKWVMNHVFGGGSSTPKITSGSGGGKGPQVSNTFYINSTDPKKAGKETARVQDKYYRSRYPKPAIGGG